MKPVSAVVACCCSVHTILGDREERKNSMFQLPEHIAEFVMPNNGSLDNTFTIRGRVQILQRKLRQRISDSIGQYDWDLA